MIAASSFNVLIVDDLKENLISLEAILNKDKRFNVIRAESGNEALSCILREEISLVLLDVQMPDMNGFEVAEAINGYERTKDIPIIFITAISRDTGNVLRGYGVGANDYMVKPIDPDVLRCKVNIFVELNEKKRALEDEILERKRVEEELRFNQVRYERLIESSLFAVFQCNPCGDIIEGNDSFCSLVKVSREDLRSETYNVLSVFDRNPEINGPLVGREASRSAAFRVDLCLADNRKMPVMFGAAALDDGGHICTLLDLSKEHELEVMLAQSQKMEAIGSLAGGIAHDFNNLLTVIMGYTGIIKNELDDNPTLQDRLTYVLDAAERAALLTSQLLAFGRKQVVQPTAICVNEIIERLNYMLKPLVGEGVQVSLQFGDNIPYVLFDMGQFEQVLMNLLVNARDAMNGNGEIVIKTRYDESGYHRVEGKNDFVVLSVRDTGCGMSNDVRAQIFEPFYTTKDVGKGTGLGLSTVFGIINQGQGSIEVSSVVGEGTEFVIYLPVFNGDDSSIVDSPSKAFREQVRRERRSVFVVEDEDLLRKLIEDALSLNGYEVFSFSTPSAAISFSESHDNRMDVLLLDVVMPEMNGVDLSRMLKLKYENAKVICMSGYADDLIDDEFFKDEDYSFMEKPFSVASLISKIEESVHA